MWAFGRVVGGFLVLLAIGYAVMIVLVPHKPAQDGSEVLMSGRSAADQLSKDAAALMKGR